MIKHESTHQLSIEEFKTPLQREQNPENRWVKLAKEIPWEKLSSIYCKKMHQKMGVKRKKRIIKIAAHLLIIATLIFLENQNEIMAQNIRVMMNNTNEIKYDTTKIQHLKKIKRFVYPIGKNPSSFGYHYYPESGEIACVECIRVINNSIYLIDQVYKNIKK